jgi:hypothetical protein
MGWTYTELNAQPAEEVDIIREFIAGKNIATEAMRDSK